MMIAFLRRVRQSPPVAAMIPLEAQMGYPAFSVRAGALCVMIPCYHTVVRDGRMKIFSPRYLVVAKYPSETIVRIEDFVYNHSLRYDQSAAPRDCARIANDDAKTRTRALLQAGDRVLSHAASPDLGECMDEYWRLLETIVQPAHRDFYRMITAQ